MSREKFLRGLFRAVPFLLIAAIILTLIFFPKQKKEVKAEKRVVLLWNVDTFEGGKGSRTSFLRRVAQAAEKERAGVYYLIASYTPEGAVAAYEAGQRPDLLSYGVGLSVYAEKCLPLSYEFSGGKTDAGCLAYPWCRGNYYLFSMEDDFTAQGTTAISQGGYNLSRVAAAYAGIDGEEVESTAAYVGFLSGKYRYLLGTQRDECRFAARGANVYSKPLSDYCDLYQYISVLSSEKREDCEQFLKTLLSDEVQDTLSEIGMYSIDSMEGGRTVSIFSSDEALEELGRLARTEENVKNLDKYLKFI